MNKTTNLNSRGEGVVTLSYENLYCCFAFLSSSLMKHRGNPRSTEKDALQDNLLLRIIRRILMDIHNLSAVKMFFEWYGGCLHFIDQLKRAPDQGCSKKPLYMAVGIHNGKLIVTTK